VRFRDESARRRATGAEDDGMNTSPDADLGDRLNQWAQNELEGDAEREAIEAIEQEQEQEQKRPRPQPIRWAALKGLAPPPRSWWIQDWFGPAQPTLCSGGGGIGKSLLWQTIGTALALGKEYIGATVKPLHVLMWACEDQEDEIWRRQVAICEYFGVGIEDLEGKLSVVPRFGEDNTLFDLAYGKPTFTPEFMLLREEANDVKADVLVLDNNAQVFGGFEHERHQVTMFVNGVYGIVRGRAFAPVLLGHVSRAAGSEFSGSAAWENACRMRWYMGTTLPDQRPEDDEPGGDGTVYLAKRKANYTDKDWRRLKFEHGLLVPEEYAGRRYDSAQRVEVAEQVVLKAMPKLIAAGVLPSDGKTSGDYLPTQIIAKGYAEDHSKKELAAAMNRLMGSGRLRREVVSKYSNRAPRFGLVVIP
jgi:RecA-family ATPase